MIQETDLGAGEGTVPNLHLQQLAYLREVERSESWSEAARRLHVSQPALSQSLRELERRLDLPLFERSGRRQVLTEAGRELAGFARRVLAEAAAVGARLDVQRAGEGGRLRVGMIDAASLYVLPVAIRTFRQENPGVHLELTVAASGELLSQLRRFELDLAVVTGPREDDDLEGTTIGREPLYVYGPPEGRIHLSQAEWVLYPRGSHTRGLIDLGFVQRGIEPRVVLESHNPQVLQQMVRLGFGCSVLPPTVAESGDPPLRRRGAAIARRSLVAVRRRSAPADARAARFLELARPGGR